MDAQTGVTAGALALAFANQIYTWRRNGKKDASYLATFKATIKTQMEGVQKEIGGLVDNCQHQMSQSHDDVKEVRDNLFKHIQEDHK